jgi:hypothetical protein
MGRSPYLDTITRIGALALVDAIKDAQDAYGKALGVTTSKPPETSPELRAKRDAALDALKEYIVKVVAWADPLEPGSEALSEALLAPIEAWTSPESSSASSSEAQTDSSGDEAGAADSSATG